MLTTDTMAKEAVAQRGRGDGRRHGEGRGDAVARDGDDARRASRPTRRSTRRCCSARSRRRSRETLRLPHRRRVPLDERHGARARQWAGRRGRRARAHRRARPRCAARWPSRWRATPRARPSSCGSASSAPASRPRRSIAARAVANSQLVQCSLNGDDPYWGRVLSELGASGAFLDPEAGRHLLQRRHRVPRRRCVRARRGGAGTGDGRHEIEILCDLRTAHGEATVLTTDLSHAYIDENRRTS